MRIVRYKPDYKRQWDAFVTVAANSCFLHERNFMEYHSDRFHDHSLMFFEGEKLVSCLPAHTIQSTFYSHLGLTYGGLLTLNEQAGTTATSQQNSNITAHSYSNLVQELIRYLKHSGFHKLELKLPPPFFDPDFTQHHSYLLGHNFKTILESLDLVVNFDQEWKPSPKKTAGYRNGKFESLIIKVSDDLKLFWDELLIPQLQNRHNAKPTHTLSEIQLLQSKFPSQILQYYVESEREKIAGITLFDFGKILKVQYAAANPIGFDKNAMDFMYLEIIKEARDEGRQFVDLGTVNNRDGSINEGLLHFKKQLGAVVTPVYEIALDLRS